MNDLNPYTGASARLAKCRRSGPAMMEKLARVRVLLDEDTVTTFEQWEARHAGRIQALNRAHARLWRIGLYLHPDDYAAQNGAIRQLVNSAARDSFDLPSRYARAEIEEPYIAAVYDRIAPENGWVVGERAKHIEQAKRMAAKATHSLDLEETVALIKQAVQQEIPQNDAQASPDGPQGKLVT